MTETEHQLIRAMLLWDAQNPFASMMATFYLGRGRELVEKMLAAGADWNECAQRNTVILALIQQKKMAESSIAYGDMLVDYMAKYWPDCKDVFWKKAVEHYEEGKARVARGESPEATWPACSDGPPPAFPFRVTLPANKTGTQ
jgi:hypothetical protein